MVDISIDSVDIFSKLYYSIVSFYMFQSKLFFNVKYVFQLEMSYIFINNAYSFTPWNRQIYCKCER